MKARTRISAALLVAMVSMAPITSMGAVAPTPADSPEALARELLEASGSSEVFEKGMGRIFTNLREDYAGVPDEVWNQLLAEMRPQLEAAVIPVYVRHLTVEEMTAALEFYRSPAGRSMVRKLPTVLDESMALGREFGAKIAVQVRQRAADYVASHPGVIDDRGAQKQALRDLRNVGTAMMAWLTDNMYTGKISPCSDVPATFGGACPVATHAAVKTTLVNLYIQAVPEKDPWGHPYQFVLDQERFAVGIRSPGRDGKYEGDSYTSQTHGMEEYDRDLVWWAGFFVRNPEAK